MRMAVILLLFSALLLEAGVMDGYYEKSRAEMVEVIKDDVKSTWRYLGKEHLDSAVVDAMGKVPRHEFVPIVHRMRSYVNKPLPIGHGQTISQPYIVAIMTDLIEPRSDMRVLEIGTGSGYQAAVLAEVAKEVYSIEVIPELARSAGKRLDKLGYENVKTRTGDGYYGWEEHAPYDAIVVTAAAGNIPPPLIEQLKPGGKMII
ncbi:MAG: protein-L-isoaspartate(D-aspartate) O-methyltransferase, partial [Sulfurimonadaceae bacterium]|nr:protein-L-isoaspartate(D-aspartate) O-methyltransferase [Sulfurimonadaceae bacterium]